MEIIFWRKKFFVTFFFRFARFEFFWCGYFSIGPWEHNKKMKNFFLRKKILEKNKFAFFWKLAVCWLFWCCSSFAPEPRTFKKSQKYFGEEIFFEKIQVLFPWNLSDIDIICCFILPICTFSRHLILFASGLIA